MNTHDFKVRDKINHEARLYLLVGPSRLGKSTWANEFITVVPSVTIVSADDIRRAMGFEWNRDMEPMVHTVKEYMAKAHLERGVDVILDETSLTEARRNKWRGIAKRYGAEVRVIRVTVPKTNSPEWKEWKKRAKRDQFDWSIIKRQLKMYEPPEEWWYAIPNGLGNSD